MTAERRIVHSARRHAVHGAKGDGRNRVSRAFPQVSLKVTVDPIVKLVREGRGELGPSIARHFEKRNQKFVE